MALLPSQKPIASYNIYKDYIDILEQAYSIPVHNVVIRDCIGKASHIGLEANKYGLTKQASQLADFCHTIIDCAKAFGEGIYLGTVNTIETIIHPVETVKNSIIGIGVITHALSKLVSIPAECVFLYATDTDHYYIRKNEIINQLETLVDGTFNYLYTTQKRDIIKQGASIMTEGILLTKIFTFAHNLSKNLLPITKSYFEYVIKKEPVFCLAESIGIEIPKNINSSYTQNFIAIENPNILLGPIKKRLKNTIKDIITKSTIYIKFVDGVLTINHSVINSLRTGSALKLDSHHAFSDIIDNFARYAKNFNIQGNDGLVRKLYQIEGSLNGYAGIFEWMVDPRANLGVTHRLFIKNGKITGKPNVF